MATTLQLFTADDLLEMANRGRFELIRGELKTMSPAGNIHGRIASAINASLYIYVTAHGLGAVYAAETGFFLARDPDTVRAPDVAFVRRERLEEVGEVEGYWPGAPDLAVEVISPNDRFAEVEEKVFDWLEAGTAMVIVANPKKRTATVYRSFEDITVLTEADVVRGADVVEGWEMRVGNMFGDMIK